MKQIDPTLICQVKKPKVYLPCKKKVNDFRCERIESHSANHWVGEHTIRHAIAGEEYSCEKIEGIEASKLELSLPRWTSKKSEAPQAPRQKLSRKSLSWLITAAIIFPILVAVMWQLILVPQFRSGSDSFQAVDGAITGSNNKLVTFTGQKIENVNVSQKALARNGKATSPPGFIFNNGKEVKGRKPVDLYVDFSSQNSRDFLLLNQTILLALVESGRIELNLHTVPSGTAFSVYSAEALAEAFYLNPDRSWGFMLSILKFETSGAQTKDADDLAKSLAKLAKKNKIEGITADSIQNGTFASWLISIDSDNKLNSGSKLPSLYLDDKKINLATIDLNASTEFFSSLREDK